jgi:hypothetical protein
MPFELSSALKSTCGWSFSSRGMNNLFCNKFYTSAILTIIIMVLVMLIYPCKKGTPAWITFKLGFYVLIFTMGIMFVHDGVMYYHYEKERDKTESDEMVAGFDGSGNVAFTGGNMAVNPAVGGDRMSESGESYVGEERSNKKIDGVMENEEIFSMFGV